MSDELTPDQVMFTRAELNAIIDQRNALQAFKDWVHAYLDARGVPRHPPGTHGAEGCRIGDRLDWVFARVAAGPFAAVPGEDVS